MNYLNQEELKARLSIGKAVEQWLKPNIQTDYTVLRWLRIEREKSDKYIVQYIECFDDGDEDFLDIYEFSPIHPDEEFKLDQFDLKEDALIFVKSNYEADASKFVSDGMIQEEYRKYLKGK